VETGSEIFFVAFLTVGKWVDGEFEVDNA